MQTYRDNLCNKSDFCVVFVIILKPWGWLMYITIFDKKGGEHKGKVVNC